MGSYSDLLQHCKVLHLVNAQKHFLAGWLDVDNLELRPQIEGVLQSLVNVRLQVEQSQLELVLVPNGQGHRAAVGLQRARVQLYQNVHL